MRWTILVARPAQKQLEKVPAKDRRRIVDAIQRMAEDPLHGDVLKLEGETARWRRRVGNYRISLSWISQGGSYRLAPLSAVPRRRISPDESGSAC